MTPVSKLRALRVRRTFEKVVAVKDGMIDLTLAAILVAAEEEEVDVHQCLEALEQWGAEARRRPASSNAPELDAFNRFFFGDLRFHGNEEDYFDTRNSFLNRVIERRTGIPITLSLVYMDVARRAGFYVEGVGMPGHFIVRVKTARDETGVLIDPFYGTTLTEAKCQERLDSLFAGQVALRREHLRAALPGEILVRMLGNLKAIYLRHELYKQALSVVDRILLVTPNLASEVRDRAFCLARTGSLNEAIEEFRNYLKLAAGTPDAAQIRAEMNQLITKQSSLN